jgi:8-oxo-dGTP pyrophosphatase MutT (NUDIX family)
MRLGGLVEWIRFRLPRGRPNLQVGALPWRRRANGAVEILLVTSRGTGRWILPKGWPMRDRSPTRAAAQEAFEEAGVRGRIDESEAGRFVHLKTRLGRAPLPCLIIVHHLAVDEELDSWPEQGQRLRQWFTPADAAQAVESSQLAEIITGLERAIGDSE